MRWVHVSESQGPTCAVGSIIIVSEDTEKRSSADSHLCDVRHEVVGRALRVLTNQTTLVRSDRVEIPKQNHVPFLRRQTAVDESHDLPFEK